MVQIRSGSGVARCFLAAVAAVGLTLLPRSSDAQPSGKGFLFRPPSGQLTLRGGYTLANTSGEPYSIMKEQTTVGSRSFDGITAAADLGFYLTDHLDAVLSLDYSGRRGTAAYRDWEENGEPITHENSLDRVGLTAGLRYNLTDRGRRISALAWIPASTVPYVGLGGGVMWYDFRQKGDFVEETDAATADIFTDELHSSHQSLLGVAYAGLDHRLSAHWSVIGEARYQRAAAKLVSDYEGLGDIQLSGLALMIGVSARF